jgi:hypothetical protein
MADLAINLLLVVPASNAQYLRGDAGELALAGAPVYRKASDGKYYNADADEASKADAVGIAVNTAHPGQPISVQVGGDIDLGATLTVGETYVVSDTIAKIAPIADLGAGDIVTILGVATAAANMRMGVLASSTAKA